MNRIVLMNDVPRRIQAVPQNSGLGFVSTGGGDVGSSSSGGGSGEGGAIVGAVIQGVALAMSLLRGRKGGQQKLQASQYANEAERLLQTNLAAFLSSPWRANQSAALLNFDQAWEELRTLCGDPALGDAGRRCVSERDRGGKWDWFKVYRDPIARPLELSPTTTGATTMPVQGNSWIDQAATRVWVAAAMVAAGLVLMSTNRR